MTPILFNTILVAIILCIMRICNHKSFLPVCLYISLLMISEDDQFHHLEERIGPRK